MHADPKDRILSQSCFARIPILLIMARTLAAKTKMQAVMGNE